MTKEVISKYVIKKNTKMADAMKKIDDNSAGIVFVIDDNNCLCGALSDDNIRRGLLMSAYYDLETTNRLYRLFLLLHTSNIKYHVKCRRF